MQEVTLTVTLKLEGPILTHSTAPGASHVSTPFARDQKGLYYLPGSLVKGRLREAWTELGTVTDDFLQRRCGLSLEQLLGDGSGNQQNEGVSTEPRRGRLHFENFTDVSTRPSAPSEGKVRYRIKLDEARGSVSKGAFQIVEAPYSGGEEVSFVGQIHFRAVNADIAEKIRDSVRIGLRWITNVGANCNVGFGRLVDAEIVDVHYAPLPTTKISTIVGTERFDIELNLLSPFCISRPRIADNLFESEITIPGAVLKGSLAHTWRALRGDDPDGEIGPGYDPSRPELSEHYHLVRFTHAFPADQGQQFRPVTPPFSLVKVHNRQEFRDELFDVALFDQPILIGQPVGNEQLEWHPPAFSIDWKDTLEVKRLFGWANPKRELRVRTAIDPVRRKTKEEQLFAYEMIVPDGVAWHARVDVSAIPSAARQKTEEQLLGLLNQGLRGIGKTKAQADVSIRTEGSIQPRVLSNREPKIDPATEERIWVVTLQTPAILCNTQKILTDGLFEAYRQAWDQLAESSLRLKNFFARQSLAGGYYLYRRFMRPGAYYHYLLTESGSVFTLTAMAHREHEGQATIDDWLARGLPVPDFDMPQGRYESLPCSDWHNCPYVPEGGYGEIAVNLDIHWDKRPNPPRVKEL
jgi:hypothetical protein